MCLREKIARHASDANLVGIFGKYCNDRGLWRKLYLMKSIRAKIEETERLMLHPLARLSSGTKGRMKSERESPVRTAFQRDRDRIIHSKAFRRLKHKTQVFLAPKGDHYRTRLTHALEVSQIARTISRALRLNEDLTEAVALGHDLGHTPFGHAGEDVLRQIIPGGFDHHVQGLRVVDFLEKDGRGLNLTHEVRDGILRHSKGKGELFPKSDKGLPETLEGRVARVSDIIAYLNHDLDDALRAGMIKKSDIPESIIRVLGLTNSKRIDAMVKDFVYTSLESGLEPLGMSEGVLSELYRLRDFLYERVYNHERTWRELGKARKILTDLFEHYMKNPDPVFEDVPADRKADRKRMVCDFLAGMTDHFALTTYERLFIPRQWE